MDLAFGLGPLPIQLPDEGEGVDLRILEPPPAPAGLPDLPVALANAARTALAPYDRPGTRVALIVSDASRAEPRAALYEACRGALARVADGHMTLCVANGTHAPGDVRALGLPDAALTRHRVYNHDGLDERALVTVGTTARRTPVRVARVAAAADLIVATGRIRPHYFAGYGAGAKAIFPGLGQTAAIRKNHLLKADPGSRLGRVTGNPCREDAEEAAGLVGGARVLVNVVMADSDRLVTVVAGEPVRAFREGVERARPLHEATLPFAGGADVVVAADRSPVTDTLYQACKLLPPAGLCMAPGGQVVLVAACEHGTGPLETVMHGIWELGVRRYVQTDRPVRLVSRLPPGTRTFASPAATVEEAVQAALGRVQGRRPRLLVLPRASELVPVPHVPRGTEHLSQLGQVACE